MALLLIISVVIIIISNQQYVAYAQRSPRGGIGIGYGGGIGTGARLSQEAVGKNATTFGNTTTRNTASGSTNGASCPGSNYTNAPPSIPTAISNNITLKNSSFTFSPTIPPRWAFIVCIQASHQYLSQIRNVIYHVSQPNTLQTNEANATSPMDNFSSVLSVVGGFPLAATLYFKNGTGIELGPLNIRPTIPHGYETLSLINLNLHPTMTSLLNATINGEVTSKEGNITKIHVDWGDNKTSESNKFPFFPFLHNYSKAGQLPPTINVTAYSSVGLSQSQSVQTQTLLVQRSVTKDSSVGVNTYGTVNASTTSPSIPEDSSTPFTVWGTLSNSTNGSGIRNQPINIIFLNIANIPSYETPPIHTYADGNYSYSYPNLNFLSHGQYKVLVKVLGHNKFAGLNATKDLIVLARPLTSDQLVTYLATGIGVTVTIIGIITKVPGYFTSKKQANYLSMYMEMINKKYNEFNKDGNGRHNKRQYLNNLEDIRNAITYLLQRRDINENQFKMLDDKISDYQQKISNT